MIESRFRKTFGPIPDSEVSEFERRYDVQLPTDYRDFLLTINGGFLNSAYEVQYANNRLAGILSFHGIADETNIDALLNRRNRCLGESLEMQFVTYQDRGRLPKGTMPIGSDDGGNLILLGVSKKNYGHVFWWNHDDEPLEDWHEEVDGPFPNTSLIADSFSEFLQKLRPWVPEG